MRRILSVILAICVLSGCSRVTEQSQTIFSMDTVMTLKIYSRDSAAINDARAEITRLDTLLDRGDSAGDIYKINEKKTSEVSAETIEILRAAQDVSQKTHGAFDITTAPLSDLWGFYSSEPRVPSDDEINTALTGVGYEGLQITDNTVTIPENTSLDLGGIAKGYASDKVVEVLKKDGVSSAIISLGGNVYALGNRPDGGEWSVGITDPDDKNSLIGTVKTHDKAVVTSGSYQRCFEQDSVTYHHIIDPATGKSAASGLKSVTVIADSGTRADALSTALFVMGLQKSTELWRKGGGFDAVFITDDGNVHVTEGIHDSFKCERDFSVISLSDE